MQGFGHSEHEALCAPGLHPFLFPIEIDPTVALIIGSGEEVNVSDQKFRC